MKSRLVAGQVIREILPWTLKCCRVAQSGSDWLHMLADAWASSGPSGPSGPQCELFCIIYWLQVWNIPLSAWSPLTSVVIATSNISLQNKSIRRVFSFNKIKIVFPTEPVVWCLRSLRKTVEWEICPMLLCGWLGGGGGCDLLTPVLSLQLQGK